MRTENKTKLTIPSSLIVVFSIQISSCLRRIILVPTPPGWAHVPFPGNRERRREVASIRHTQLIAFRQGEQTERDEGVTIIYYFTPLSSHKEHERKKSRPKGGLYNSTLTQKLATSFFASQEHAQASNTHQTKGSWFRNKRSST